MEQERVPVPGEFYRHFKDKLYQVKAVTEKKTAGESKEGAQNEQGEIDGRLSRFLEAPSSAFS